MLNVIFIMKVWHTNKKKVGRNINKTEKQELKHQTKFSKFKIRSSLSSAFKVK